MFFKFFLILEEFKQVLASPAAKKFFVYIGPILCHFSTLPESNNYTSPISLSSWLKKWKISWDNKMRNIECYYEFKGNFPSLKCLFSTVESKGIFPKLGKFINQGVIKFAKIPTTFLKNYNFFPILIMNIASFLLSKDRKKIC